ncbi:MAG TPA: hypothetical protein VF064_17500, partial [Pyrinomonadaceae bacterium]
PSVIGTFSLKREDAAAPARNPGPLERVRRLGSGGAQDLARRLRRDVSLRGRLVATLGWSLEEFDASAVPALNAALSPGHSAFAHGETALILEGGDA